MIENQPDMNSSTASDAVMAAMETETDPLPDCVAAAWDCYLDPPHEDEGGDE